jgi:hypothetical protein
MWTEKRKFGPHPELPTARSSYLDGHDTGTWWANNWQPGGPHVQHVDRWDREPERMKRKPFWIAYCEATLENYTEWHRGFQDGKDSRPIKLPECNIDHIAELGYN